MDDLCVKIDLVLNECSRTLSTLENKNIEGPAFYSTIFIVSIETFFSQIKFAKIVVCDPNLPGRFILFLNGEFLISRYLSTYISIIFATLIL